MIFDYIMFLNIPLQWECLEDSYRRFRTFYPCMTNIKKSNSTGGKNTLHQTHEISWLKYE